MKFIERDDKTKQQQTKKFKKIETVLNKKKFYIEQREFFLTTKSFLKVYRHTNTVTDMAIERDYERKKKLHTQQQNFVIKFDAGGYEFLQYKKIMRAQPMMKEKKKVQKWKRRSTNAHSPIDYIRFSRKNTVRHHNSQ